MDFSPQVCRFSFFLFIFSFAASLPHKAQATVLTPQTIFSTFEKRTRQSENIRIQGESLESMVGEFNGVYDPEIGLSLGYDINRNESLSGLTNLEDKTLQSRLMLRKKLKLGTSLEVNYYFTQQRSELNPFTQTVRDSELSENKFEFTVRQPFLFNTLGSSDRLKLENAKRKDEAQKLLSVENSEDLLLNGLEIYWQAYQAKRTLELGLEARGIYQQLLKSTKERKRLGQGDSGDVARVEAIFEAQSQKVKRASSQYLNSVDNLYHFLEQEPPKDEISFSIPKTLPLPPEDADPALADLRVWKAENATLDAIEAERGALRMQDLPLLDLVGQASWNGVDSKASQSLSEAFSANRPRYFVGIEFGFKFGNSGTRSKINNLANQMTAQKNNLFLTKNTVRMETAALKRQIQSLFQITKSAQKSVSLYRTLVKAQKRNFRQGRIQLNSLIEDYTRLFDSELVAIDSLASYHITLHRWAAHADQLIQ